MCRRAVSHLAAVMMWARNSSFLARRQVLAPPCYREEALQPVPAQAAGDASVTLVCLDSSGEFRFRPAQYLSLEGAASRTAAMAG